MYWEGKMCYCSFLALTFWTMSFLFLNKYTMNRGSMELGWIVSMNWFGFQLWTIQYNGVIQWMRNLKACSLQCHGSQCTTLQWSKSQSLGSLKRCGTLGTGRFLWCSTLKASWFAQMHSIWCGFGEAMPSPSPARERNLCGGRRHGGLSF